MKYDVEADWHLLNTCNYRCPYCFLTSEMLSQKIRPSASNEAWEKAFNATGLTWLLHMTGGEPSAYPNFVDLCERLSQNHLLSINSNMTNRSWEDFAKRVSPKRVGFINAGVHLKEREDRKGNDIYLRNISLLRDAGFQIMCSLVLTSDVIARFAETIALVAPVGMYPIPKLMRGPHDGKVYPGAYTRQERKLFKIYTAAARRFYEPLLANREDRPTIDMFSDSDMVHGTPNYQGLICEAGRLFFRIESNADVLRCGDSRRHGNLLAGTFFREDSASRCDTTYCYYFCNKYSQPQPLHRTAYRKVRGAAREARDIIFRSGGSQ